MAAESFVDEFRNIGLFLNGEPGDDEAIAFTTAFARLNGAKSIACLHIRPVEGGGAIQWNAEEVLQRISALSGQGPSSPEIRISETADVADILQCARERSLDLVVVGRRLPHDQLAVGTTFVRLARKSPCSVLIVPDQSQPRFGRLLVPSDGSEHAHMALRQALLMARASGEPNPQVTVHNVFTVGYGYRYTGLSLSDAIKEREQVMLRQIKSSVADLDVSGVKVDLVCTSSESPVQAVYDMAASRGAEMIVAGSRGRTQSAAILLGSFVERLLVHCPMPLMIVKRKGETLRFLAALLNG